MHFLKAFAVFFSVNIQACSCIQFAGAWNSNTSTLASRTCDLGKDLSWALFIDGKDANRGPYAYGDSYTMEMLTAWRSLQTDVGFSKELEKDDVLQIHREGCDQGWWGKLRAPWFQAMVELPGCFREMHSTLLKHQILEDLPHGGKDGDMNVVHVHMNEQSKVEYLGTKHFKSTHAVVDQLRLLLDRYNADIRSTTLHDDELRLHILARFLRSFAWLHPFADCNGRTRVLVLQRELQRLGLGCGAIMFNNNADIYFETTDTYAAKLREGISMYKIASDTHDDRNPWLNHARRDEHLAKFPIPEGLTGSCQTNFMNVRKDLKLSEVNTLNRTFSASA